MAGPSWSEAEARAKINLRLIVFPPGADGYHPLETVFCRIDFADTVRLRLVDEPGVALSVTGTMAAPAGADNLAVRAAQRLLRDADAKVGVRIELEKRIPPGAGLGGGSSDAAATLRLLNDGLDSPLTEPELLAIGAELGSDVPFFVSEAPLALAWGRGERLLPGPRLEPRPLILALPEESVSTPEAYAALDEWRRGKPSRAADRALDWADLSDWPALASSCENDFEEVVFARHSRLKELKNRLLVTRPRICSLSGSGSALFAVYDTVEERDAALGDLEGELEGVRLVSASAPE